MVHRRTFFIQPPQSSPSQAPPLYRPVQDPNGPTGTEISTFYGALIDNNLLDPYLPPTPMGGAPVSLSSFLMGEHQCMVGQIMSSGAPIPNGAQPECP